MGQSCMQKSKDMVLYMMYTAHNGSSGLMKYYTGEKGKKGDYGGEYYDYEKVILLEEDADDYNAFDYEDQSVQQLLNKRNPAIQGVQGQSYQSTGESKVTVHPSSSDKDEIGLVIDEIESNLLSNPTKLSFEPSDFNMTTQEDSQAQKSDDEMKPMDEEQLMSEMNAVLNYDDDDEEQQML